MFNFHTPPMELHAYLHKILTHPMISVKKILDFKHRKKKQASELVTDRPAGGPTDNPSYKDGRTHLKIEDGLRFFSDNH